MNNKNYMNAYKIVKLARRHDIRYRVVSRASNKKLAIGSYSFCQAWIDKQNALNHDHFYGGSESE